MYKIQKFFQSVCPGVYLKKQFSSPNFITRPLIVYAQRWRISQSVRTCYLISIHYLYALVSIFYSKVFFTYFHSLFYLHLIWISGFINIYILSLMDDLEYATLKSNFCICSYSNMRNKFYAINSELCLYTFSSLFADCNSVSLNRNYDLAGHKRLSERYTSTMIIRKS